MKKKLPTLKKSLINFATQEDAKVMNKAFTKVALIGSAVSFGVIEDLYAADYVSHANTLTIPNANEHDQAYPYGYKTNNVDEAKHEARNQLEINNQLYNPEESKRDVNVRNLPKGEQDANGIDSVEVPQKSVVAHHANHYNTIPGGSGGGYC